MARKPQNKRNAPSRQRGRKRALRKGTQSNADKYAQMVIDPCNGPMLEGFYSTSEGMLNKLKSTYTPATGQTTGYILWDPTYVSETGASQDSFSCVIATTASSATNPTNSIANPFGGPGSQSTYQQVGAGAFATSATVADARTVGACLRMSYTGRMDASSGLIAVLENIPAETVLGQNGTTPVSVDELFNLSSQIARFGVDTAEVKYRPNDYSNVFRSEREGVWNFNTGSLTVVNAEAERTGSRLMGFAFKGISDTADLLLEFHQNIEWRPNVDTGFITTRPLQLKPAGHSQSIVQRLDRALPGWSTNIVNKAEHAASEVAKMALTGMATRYAGQLANTAMRSSVRYLAAEAPLLLTL